MLELEDEVFLQKSFVPAKMKSFGFQKLGNQYIYETDFINGDFHAVLSVFKNGTFTAKVIDKINNEEYKQLRSENYNGAYINSVREAYRQLLDNISKAVCDDVFFASEQANRITEIIMSRYKIKPDFPWNKDQYQNYGTFRHADTKKWFALVMNVNRYKLLKNKDKTAIDIINLKTDRLEEISCRTQMLYFLAKT